ncbi:hypothetical protein IQ241_07450 [Romeria aff. gracilis LEGE 07310]|uniref:Uncharacterized protein n=1 Tax=Vasconcelosia minhoensis LEGE 07310 TaxID=915328 RepID=A0A8J7A5X3_9CYAN|nr:hypothetical protein [Romeria gracilis]MBE9077132.1 hypothetical protein [Romeria aff. gracilis LEGE 07310]
MEQHKWRDDTRQLAIAPRLWLWWTLAPTIAGAIVGALEASGFFQLVATIFFTGLLIGAAQWLVLRQYIPKAFWWIVVSTQGWTFGLALVSSFITPLFDPLIQFLSTLGAWPVFWSNLVTQPIVLAIFGTAQFPILTRFVRKAEWWILVSALGGALDGASSSTVAYILQSGLLPAPLPTALGYGAGWLSYGIVTGICLQWLLRHHPR